MLPTGTQLWSLNAGATAWLQGKMGGKPGVGGWEPGIVHLSNAFSLVPWGWWHSRLSPGHPPVGTLCAFPRLPWSCSLTHAPVGYMEL